MNGVGPEGEVEGLVLILFNKFGGFGAEMVGEVGSFFGIFDRAISVRGEPGFGLSVGAAADVGIETIIFGVPGLVDDTIFRFDGAFTGEVPFADEAGGVTLFFEFTGVAREVEWKVLDGNGIARATFGAFTLVACFAWDMSGHSNLRGRHAGYAGGAGGGADRAGGVGFLESHPSLGKTLEIGGVDLWVTVIVVDPPGAEVVGHDKYDVGFLSFAKEREEKEGGEVEGERECFHAKVGGSFILSRTGSVGFL